MLFIHLKFVDSSPGLSKQEKKCIDKMSPKTYYGILKKVVQTHTVIKITCLSAWQFLLT